MALSKWDEARQSQKLIRVKDAIGVVSVYAAATWDRQQRVDYLAATLARRHNSSFPMSAILDPPKTWPAVAWEVYNFAVDWAQNASRITQIEFEGFMVKQSQSRFVLEEGIAIAMLQKTLTQAWPKVLPPPTGKSRGHRLNRNRN